MYQPKVSVIIPVYKVEDYLDRCVESVVNQTYKNLEIILIDDGSPDNCPRMCDDWAKKDNRIKVIHKENAGAGFARNTGLDNSGGNYVTFVDSDDYLAPETVEKCIDKVYETSADAVLFGRIDTYDDGRKNEFKITDKKLLHGKESVLNELLPGMFTYSVGFGVSVWGKLYRLDIINENNIRFESEKEIFSEDACFNLLYFSKVSVAAVIPQCFYYYCKRTDSLSRVFDRKRQMKLNAFFEKCTGIIESNGLPECVATHFKARYHIYTIGEMKQIIVSSLPEKEKYYLLKEMINNGILQDTLTEDTLKLCNAQSRFFWQAVKRRCVFLCMVMLKFKIRK